MSEAPRELGGPAAGTDIPREIPGLVLAVHRRNGGKLASLDLGLRLLDPALAIDSLDLAEIMVAIERKFGVSPFESEEPPRTWGDIVALVRRNQVGTAPNLEG